MTLAVFGYGSLVSRSSIAETIGGAAGDPLPVRLLGWRRRWTLARDNRTAEKGFEPAGGAEPFDWVLGLDLTRGGPSDWVNGALIAVDEPGLDRLRLREIRYDPVELDPASLPGRFERVVAFTAKAANRFDRPPPRAVVLRPYLEACEEAFAELGPGELEAFRLSTGPPPVPVVEARLVRDEVPEGNPRRW